MAALHWPFATLTPHQLRQVEAQRAAMLERRLLRWPEKAALACATAALLTACGGGGDADEAPDVPPPHPVDCHTNPLACK